jgi:raffinose synthase
MLTFGERRCWEADSRHLCSQELEGGVRFAPIGLLAMFNSGGAIVGMSTSANTVVLDIKGCGQFGMWASEAPTRCTLENGEQLAFAYDKKDSRLTMDLPIPEADHDWRLEIAF